MASSCRLCVADLPWDPSERARFDPAICAGPKWRPTAKSPGVWETERLTVHQRNSSRSH